MISYHGNGQNELHMVFNFPLMYTRHLTPKWIRSNQKERLKALYAVSPTCWPCNTLGNHDSPRVYNRFGDGQHDAELARLHLALMLTLKGTPFLYNGEEIGMVDLRLTDIDQFRDLVGVWQYNAMIAELGLPKEIALAKAAENSRDKNRTPNQWRNAPNAGFCPETVQPWLPVNPNYAQGVNVADQEMDPDSLLNFYNRMLRVRKATLALQYGDYHPLHETASDYLAFLRTTEAQTCLVILNYSDQRLKLDFQKTARKARIIYSNYKDEGLTMDLKSVSLNPFEIFIAQVTMESIHASSVEK